MLVMKIHENSSRYENSRNSSNIYIICVSIIPECKKVIMADPWFSSSLSVATISTLDLALSDSGFDAIEEPISMHFDLIEIGCPNLCWPNNVLVTSFILDGSKSNKRKAVWISYDFQPSKLKTLLVSLMHFLTFMKKNNISIFGIFNIVNAFYSVLTHFSFGMGSRDIFIVGEYVTSISILKKWSLPRFRFYFKVVRIFETKGWVWIFLLRMFQTYRIDLSSESTTIGFERP